MNDALASSNAQSLLRHVAQALGAVLATVAHRVQIKTSLPGAEVVCIVKPSIARSRRATRGIAWATRGQGSCDAMAVVNAFPFTRGIQGGPFRATFFYGKDFPRSWPSAGRLTGQGPDRAAFLKRLPSPSVHFARAISNQNEWNPK